MKRRHFLAAVLGTIASLPFVHAENVSSLFAGAGEQNIVSFAFPAGISELLQLADPYARGCRGGPMSANYLLLDKVKDPVGEIVSMDAEEIKVRINDHDVFKLLTEHPGMRALGFSSGLSNE